MENPKTVTKTAEKKKASWTVFNEIATVIFPNGLTANFELKKLDTAVAKYYGVKQLLSDQVANIPDSAEKIAGMRAWFVEACEKGLVITETGKINIVGKTRANAVPRTQDAVITAQFTTLTIDEIKSIEGSVKLGIIKISPEMVEKLNARKAELNKGKK